MAEYRQVMAALEQEPDALVSLPPEPPLTGRLDFWKNEYGRQLRQESTETETDRRNAGSVCTNLKGRTE
jgi:hypothetical protein